MTQAIKKSKQKMVALVVSDKMQKSLVVQTQLHKRHPKYHKAYVVTRRLLVHNELPGVGVGDKVLIEAVRPQSRNKHFAVKGKF